MVTIGDFFDFMEWRKEHRSIPSTIVKIEPLNRGNPLLRVYNNGTNLYTVNRKGKFFRLKGKLHNGKLLNQVSGVTQGSKSLTIEFTSNTVTIHNSDSGISQTMHIPEG